MDNSKPNTPVIFVLFGGSGDLSRRLILPALFNLFLDRQLPSAFALLAVGHSELNVADLVEGYRQGVGKYSRRGVPAQEVWNDFAHYIHYARVDLNQVDDYRGLAQQLHSLAESWPQPPELIFYMATPPSLFAIIGHGLGEAGLAQDPARTRIVVEKPLGHDLDSFHDINAVLGRYFDETQIFRIDHFLGKETVQNILAMRFANPIFEPVWNRRYIDHVAITVAETLGVEHRSRYYEKAGALRDMVQNHLLQLLCLVAMEPPAAYDANDIRNKKMDVMHALRPIAHDQVPQFAARGQYQCGWINGNAVPGYREEDGIDPQSGTETYAALKLFVDNWRWQDVPFYLRTGKRLSAPVSEISIRFRDVPHRAFPASAGLNAQPVRLVIQIQPEQGIVMKFMAKEPGYALRLRPVNMRFNYQEAFDLPSPDAYETLLRDVMLGDGTLFMRADHVEATWRLLSPIIEVWADNPAADFPNYAAGSWGPESAETLIARDSRNWLTPTVGVLSPCPK
jgi:glucose-6-phosphate 1-dehydrogenase